MRTHCVKLLHEMDVLEIVGTGGDGANSFNISTTSALIIAAAGVLLPNTETARPPLNAALQMYWRPWGEHCPRAGKERCAFEKDQHLLSVCTKLPLRNEVCSAIRRNWGIGLCSIFWARSPIRPAPIWN